MRLDRFLGNLPDVSRQDARRLLVERRVRVDGEAIVDGRHEVRVFNRIEVDADVSHWAKVALDRMLALP